MIRLPSRINITRLVILFFSGIVLFGFVQSIFAGEADVDPAASNVAKNLARMNCGAQIECITPEGNITRASAISSPDQSTAALIMEDQTISRALQPGDTVLVIALPRTSLLNRFSFVNENATARGEVKLSVSNFRLPAKSSRWASVDAPTSFTGQRVCNLALPAIEAKYVRVSFHVEKEGRLAGLGLYGEETLANFGTRQVHVTRATRESKSLRLEDVLNFNFANVYARARVVYVSSGSMNAAQRMIDDDSSTSFRFAPNDPHPTVIVELAENARIRRATALYQMQSGRIDIYAMNELPSNPSDLHKLTPLASVTDVAAGGKAGVDFNTQGTRYMALRWTPDGTQGVNKSFEVAEVGAFGDVPLSVLNLTEAPNLYAENIRLATEAPIDPPVIPPVSP